MERGNTQELLTPLEVAEWLRCSADTVLRYARVGGLPHRRIGRRTLLVRAEVQAWLDARKLTVERKPGEKAGVEVQLPVRPPTPSGLLPPGGKRRTRMGREMADLLNR